MRIGLLAFAAWLAAPIALAQETPTPIPFAPVIPSVFTVEARTETLGDGGAQMSLEQAGYTLEIRAHADVFEATWNVNYVTTQGETYRFNPILMLGLPISLTLDSSGEPTGVADWESVQRELSERLARDTSSDFFSSAPPSHPRLAAAALAPSLATIAVCQNTNLRVGEPQRSERNYPPSHGFVMTARTFRELLSIDREAGAARIAFERHDETREEGQSAPLNVMTMRAECTVDLQSGVVREATLEATASGSLATTFTQRMHVTVTPQ
jgi:hypothetical protein